jgi:hypothetical protein
MAITNKDVHDAITERNLKPVGECIIIHKNLDRTIMGHKDWLECHDKKFREESKLMNKVFVLLILFLLGLVGNFVWERYESWAQPKHDNIKLEQRIMEQNVILKQLVDKIEK